MNITIFDLPEKCNKCKSLVPLVFDDDQFEDGEEIHLIKISCRNLASCNRYTNVILFSD